MVKTFSKQITDVNRTVMSNKKNAWLVIHYVGAVSSAKNNAIYFEKIYRGASAHYFVDETSIWQVVEDKDKAWSIGLDPELVEKGVLKYYCGARNNNSLNIEMCCKIKNGEWYIEQDTVENTLWLAAQLIKKYNIPLDHIVRHYDCTHKVCPDPFVKNPKLWSDFLKRLEESLMPDIPEISITEKREKVKQVANLDEKTINYLFDDYFHREPLLDKFYKLAVDAEKYRNGLK